MTGGVRAQLSPPPVVVSSADEERTWKPLAKADGVRVVTGAHVMAIVLGQRLHFDGEGVLHAPIDRVTVLPFTDGHRDATLTPTGEHNDAAASTFARRLEVFDVKRARCSHIKDTQRLRGSIEAGFGSYDAFNLVIRRILGEKIRG